VNPSENPNDTPPEMPEASFESRTLSVPSRRRFLGAGAVATPAILTLVSQPALGVTCFTPSRSLSKNTSKSQAGKDGLCTGAESPGNYKTQTTPGTSAYHWPISPNTKFHSNQTYGGVAGVFSGSIYGNRSLLDVLNKTNGMSDPYNVAYHLVAAYLNVLGGNSAVIASNVMNAQDVKDIWTAWLASGRTKYPVMAGTDWTGQQLVDYLISNGIVA
jgi:hypothetical protein